MAKEIVFVRVTLDDDLPEDMMGVNRCASVVSEDEDGDETEHPELIDNSEFSSAAELIKDVARRLKVDVSIVEIEVEED
jgi:hypothetical protein